MEENKDCTPLYSPKAGNFKSFISDVIAGFGMGVAFIIPGFSGGSVAAILGIYEKLVGAIADIFRDFKRSFLTLLPIFVGLVIGAVSLLYPLGWALSAFPLVTVSLFVGLALGGLSSVTDKISSRPTAANYLALALPLILAVSLSLLPTGADVDLFSLNLGGYLVLFLVGIIGSAALVVPGISGSMILLILGFYNPIIKIITEHFLAGKDVLISLLVLGSTGLGIIVGFIGISVMMKHLLNKYPRGTYMAILGFIIGSVPTVFVSAAKDAGMTLETLPADVWHWVLCVLLLLLGFALSFSLSLFGKKKSRSASEQN
jgi:putative membrane protein